MQRGFSSPPLSSGPLLATVAALLETTWDDPDLVSQMRAFLQNPARVVCRVDAHRALTIQKTLQGGWSEMTALEQHAAAEASSFEGLRKRAGSIGTLPTPKHVGCTFHSHTMGARTVLSAFFHHCLSDVRVFVVSLPSSPTNVTCFLYVSIQSNLNCTNASVFGVSAFSKG